MSNENIVMKNIIKGLLIKIINMDIDYNFLDSPIKLFANDEGSSSHGYHRQPGTYEEIMKRIVKEMNDEDWNEDDGRSKLHYNDKLLEYILEDSSDDE